MLHHLDDMAQYPAISEKHRCDRYGYALQRIWGVAMGLRPWLGQERCEHCHCLQSFIGKIAESCRKRSSGWLLGLEKLHIFEASVTACIVKQLDGPKRSEAPR